MDDYRYPISLDLGFLRIRKNNLDLGRISATNMDINSGNPYPTLPIAIPCGHDTQHI